MEVYLAPPEDHICLTVSFLGIYMKKFDGDALNKLGFLCGRLLGGCVIATFW